MMGLQSLGSRSRNSVVLSNLQMQKSVCLAGIGISHMMKYRSYSSSGPQVPDAWGSSGSGGSDWMEKLKEVSQSTVDVAAQTGEKAKEASTELTPYVEKLLDTHPYLCDVIVPVGETLVGAMLEELSYTNVHQVPKVEKIVVNCGIGDAVQNSKGLDAAMNGMALITGQRPVKAKAKNAKRPVKTKAKNATATFKIRENQTLGIAVTLRGNVMYSFLDRLINLGLPRTRDFQGVSANSFDGRGNYRIGFKEQSFFPEHSYDELGMPRGMDVCITTTAKTDKEAYKLLALMGMPFREGSGPSTVMRKKKLKSHNFDLKVKQRAGR